MKFAHLGQVRSAALVGATGLVGREFLSILAENRIRIPQLKVFASENSVGETLEYGDDSLIVEALNENSFDDIEVAFFSAPTEITEKYVPFALEAGTVVVDDSSCFRMRDEVPLVIPEVNGAVLRDFTGRLISTPNCVATPLALALKPLADRFGLERVVVSTYQSVSGAGRRAYEELSVQTAALLNGASHEPSVFPHRIAFNCLPQIGDVTDSGDSGEEEKIGNEVRKILDLPDLRLSATAVRVPTFFGHGLSVNVELQEDFGKIEVIREFFDQFEGLKVLDQPGTFIYPTNVESAGSDSTFIGRIRRDPSVTSGVNFWVIADNLRKGAALNALECLETLFHYRRMS